VPLTIAKQICSGLGDIRQFVFAAFCFAIVPCLASNATAAAKALNPKSQAPSVADIQDAKHCDDDSDDAKADDSAASVKDESDASTVKVDAKSQGVNDSDDGGDNDAPKAAAKTTAHNADSDDTKSAAADHDDSDHAQAQQDDNDKGCADDADKGGGDSDDDDAAALDPDDRATLLSQFDYYSDSQHYVNLTTTSLATAPFHGFMTSLRRDWLQARDSSGTQAAEITTLAFSKEFSELWGIGGGFGTARDLHAYNLVGSFQSHLNYEGASMTASIAREMLLESAKAVAANIHQTVYGLSLSDDLTEHVSIDSEAHHRSYSDGNSSNDIALSPDYIFKLAMGKLTMGYRFSYTAFARNPQNGYWAPQRAISNGLSTAWSFDRTTYYGRSELGLGYDSVRESGKLLDGPGGGPSAQAAVAFGIRPMAGLGLETYWTGNGSPGWSSMNFGLSLNYLF
jgi:hypothetical protein